MSVVAASASSDAPQGERADTEPWYDTFPWWGVAIVAIIGALTYRTLSDPATRLAFERTIPGLKITIQATLVTFAVACVFGMVLALMRTSRSAIARNLARTYIEFIRGVPMLVLIFTVSFVLVPELSDKFGVSNRMPQLWRGILALALIYAGYIAEIFRAGIESVDRGQVEAGRSLGLTRRQTTNTVVLPQAVRAVIPPLGNDFIAILKDTSLLSVLGILEVSLRAKQYGAGTFKYPEAYTATLLIYLTLTMVLSLVVTGIERRLAHGRKGVR